MLLRDLTKVWISRAGEVKDHGEYKHSWTYAFTAFLNLQQDINELDRNSAGETNYDIQKARTTNQYNIKNGDGISLEDIRKQEKIIPQYRVIDQTKIGNTIVYRLETYYEN